MAGALMPSGRHRARLISQVDPPPTDDPVRSDSDMAIVLEVIRKHPGLSGIEIVRMLDDEVNERTVRTALHRLRHAKKLIENQDGKWFPLKE
jgi:hypothetical protein